MNDQRQPLFIVFRTISLAFLLANLNGYSQENPGNKKVEFSLSLGCSVQFFAFDRLFLRPQSPRYVTYRGDIFYAGLNNQDGFGLPASFKAYDRKWGIGLVYEPIVRYDIVDITASGSPSSAVFLDHHFSVFHKFNLQPPFLSNPVKKPLVCFVGAGFSLISLGQSYGFQWTLYDTQTQSVIGGSRVDLSFQGFHALLGAQVYKGFSFEIKFIHVPQNQIVYRFFQSTNMLILKASYQIQFRKKRKS